jgi:hypothetical protein
LERLVWFCQKIVLFWVWDACLIECC